MRALAGWTNHDPGRDLGTLYRHVMGSEPDQESLRRVGIAVIQMVVPDWCPCQRLTDHQAELVGRVLSHLLGDLRGDLGSNGGGYRQWVARQRERSVRLRHQLRQRLEVVA